MKGYWINHVVEIRDAERFVAYAAASKTLLRGDNRYGARLKLFGSVAVTLVGKPVPHAAIVEFDSVQAAIDFWNDPDYAAARALMGPLDDESAVVDRRVCCIEAEPLTLTAKQGLWVNHVQVIINESAFFRYAEASMPLFTGASFGPVVHQHAGEQKIQLAAVLGFESIGRATSIYGTPEYAAALAAGGMDHGEGRVVDRTICAVEVSE